MDVHHPHLDTQLLDQVLVKFYWLREQSELRKKPSTSELIDWIAVLLRSGMTADDIEPTSRSSARCSRTSRTPRPLDQYQERGGSYPLRLEPARAPVQQLGAGACSSISSTSFATKASPSASRSGSP